MAKKKSTEEIIASERKFVAVCDLVKITMVCGVVSFLGYQIVRLMKEALLAKPESIDSFARCFSTWNIVELLSILASLIFGGGWYLEHKRNDRLVKHNGEIRHEIESTDSISTRSGLDSVGRTPKER